MEETRSLKPVRNVNSLTCLPSINACFVCQLSVLQCLSVRPSASPSFVCLSASFFLFIDLTIFFFIRQGLDGKIQQFIEWLMSQPVSVIKGKL